MSFLGFFAPAKEPHIAIPKFDVGPTVEKSINHALVAAADKAREMIGKAENPEALVEAIRTLDLIISEYKAMPRILIEIPGRGPLLMKE